MGWRPTLTHEEVSLSKYLGFELNKDAHHELRFWLKLEASLNIPVINRLVKASGPEEHRTHARYIACVPIIQRLIKIRFIWPRHVRQANHVRCTGAGRIVYQNLAEKLRPSGRGGCQSNPSIAIFRKISLAKFNQPRKDVMNAPSPVFKTKTAPYD